MIRLLPCLLLMMTSVGCAAERPQVLPDGPSGGAPPAKVQGATPKASLPDIAPDKVVDDSGEYEYVNTPFGLLKRKIKRTAAPASPFESGKETADSPGAAVQSAEASTSASPAASSEKGGDDEEYEIVNTPFGQLKRKKK